MKNIGVNWYMNVAPTIREQAEAIARAGFYATFIASENGELDNIVKNCNDVGVKVETLHAPYAGNKEGVAINDMWSPAGNENGEKMTARFLDAVEKCGRYEVPFVICHASSARIQPPNVNDAGLERFMRVVDRARELGVTVCFENQRVFANIAVLLDEFPDAKFCWDTGHEAVFGFGKQFMPVFGERLGALHLQDNYLQNGADIHLIPGDGFVDFNLAAKYIAKSGYSGTMMMELKKDPGGPYEKLTPDEFYARAFRGGERVGKMVESQKELI